MINYSDAIHERDRQQDRHVNKNLPTYKWVRHNYLSSLLSKYYITGYRIAHIDNCIVK